MIYWKVIFRSSGLEEPSWLQVSEMRRWLCYIPAGFMPFWYVSLIDYSFFVKEFQDRIRIKGSGWYWGHAGLFFKGRNRKRQSWGGLCLRKKFRRKKLGLGSLLIIQPGHSKNSFPWCRFFPTAILFRSHFHEEIRSTREKMHAHPRSYLKCHLRLPFFKF